MISIVVAIDNNNAIGCGGDQLVYLSEDLKHFKKITNGGNLVMGRKTFEALPKGALPNRRNIVLTHNASYKAEGVEVVTSIDELEDEDDYFVIGGAEIYKLFMPVADKLYVTHIDNIFENADAFFPKIEDREWELTEIEPPIVDKKTGLGYHFAVYERKAPALPEPTDLLSAIEVVIELSKDSSLSPKFFKQASRALNFIAQKMDVTKRQAALLALLVNFFDVERIDASMLTDHLDCSPIRFLHFMNDIEELEKRQLVRCRRHERGRTYRVPYEVVEAIKNDKKFEPDSNKNLDNQQLMTAFEKYFKLREDNEISYVGLMNQIKQLLADNRHLVFCEKILGYGLDDDDLLLLVAFCHLFVNNGDNQVHFFDLEFIYDSTTEYSVKFVQKSLEIGKHPLMLTKLVEFNNEEGFVNRSSYCLSKSTKDDLFVEFSIASLNVRGQRNNLTKSEDIAEKKLYFDAEVQGQIDELGKLLDESNYTSIRERLKTSGFRCGFTCIFYGMPGTGKTETALQLARLTGRDIMQVNIAQIKSKWVGESEKNIKGLFDAYRIMVRDMPLAPILLFNEADGIINKRQENASQAIEKMENAIQNIILEEMETLDGILIATTNLITNLDQAFERRFLYKVKFTKPNADARASIWREFVPSLTDETTRALAEKYDFTGGQIENIARHHAIDAILYGEKANDLDNVRKHCERERLEKELANRIGFGKNY